HTRITVEDLSDLTSLSPDYLSRLFKRETGQSVSEYIRSQKILAAQNMLIYSDYTPGQIAQFLAFNSQSYFTEVFRQVTGQTPTAFRNENLRSTDIGRRNDTGDSGPGSE
ncbi:MAG: helix-turn-helix transcriptional regulator, partial [Lachnospiraceae bacterium]|nr:helix-turn-helix transcriptional regulator [Lachnospiraceae bacterium]